jgi:mono/diheme cytochrome c family protein
MSARPAAMLMAGLTLVTGGASAVSAEAPQILYMLQCQGCHLADGSGAPGSVPSLAGLERFLAVPGGREYLVRVPGSAQSPLSDAELAAVLNWMIREFGLPEVAADFAPYSAGEVAGVRHPPLTDVDDVRRDLLRRIARRGRESSPVQAGR